MTQARERAYSETRIRRELRRYLAPALVDKFLAELEEGRPSDRRREPPPEAHADAARFLRRHGLR